MGEEFHGGIYSASWWSSSRKGIERSVTAPANSCSVGIADIGAAFSWTPEIMEGGRNDDVQRLEISDSMEVAPFMADYSQALQGRVDEGFMGLPQDFVNQGFMADGCFSDSFCPSSILPGSYQDTTQPSWLPFPPYLKTSSTPQQMHLSDNTHFYPPLQSHFDHKSEPTKIKSIPEVVRELSGDSKKSGDDPAASFKKPRMETPSSLPTFKVRKEKLGDRITALQQLVSPFGKTDTASVLHEAIDYIKFLHDQVSVLTTPYLQNPSAMQPQRNSEKQKSSEGLQRDLRSRGLCLVPISSTLAVASEPMADFWTPTFGATYR